MTSKFNSKEIALEEGLRYAGFGDAELRQEKLKRLTESKPEPTQIGWPHNKEVDLYKTKTPQGVEIGLGIGRFREGYDLWLIDIKSGAAQRA